MQTNKFTLHSFVLLFLLDGMTEIEGVLKSPEISVPQTFLSKGQSAKVICEVSSSHTKIEWFLYRNAEDRPFKKDTDSGNLCEFTVTGTELLQGGTQDAIYAAVNLSCQYSDGDTRSPRSKKVEIKVLGELKAPQLTVSSTNITETDSVQLSCESPQSVPVSHCQFLSNGHIVNKTSSPCRRSFTGAQLLRGTIHPGDTQIVVRCLYTVRITETDSPSQQSNGTTVTVRGFPVNSTPVPVSRPDLTAVISMDSKAVTESGSVGVTCAGPHTVQEASWSLYTDTRKLPVSTQAGKGNSFRFSVTRKNLLEEQAHTAVYTIVQLSCEYTVKDTHAVSQRSNRQQLVVLGKLPSAKMTLSPAIVTQRDSVRLSCEGPQNVPVSRCQFHTEKKKLTETPSDCRLSITGAELLNKGGHSLISGDVQVDCQYIVGEGADILSPHSDGLRVTLIDMAAPTINVSRQHNGTVIHCVAPAPVTGALFYLYKKGIAEPMKKLKAAERETAVTFTVPPSPNTAGAYCCAYDHENLSSPLSNCTGSEHKRSESSMWATTGVVLAMVLFLLGVVTVCLYKGYKKKKCSRQETTQGPVARMVTSSSDASVDDTTYAVITDPATSKPLPSESGSSGENQGTQNASDSQQQEILLHTTSNEDPNYATIDDLPAASAEVTAVYSLAQLL